MFARIEDMQAGAAPHRPGRHREMSLGDAKGCAATRTLGNTMIHDPENT
jgi:hypothetical protein